MVILFFTRFLFKKVVFHFHAAGVSTLYDSLPRLLKFFFRRCYFYPDAGVRLSQYNPGDPEFLKAKKEWLVPNGVEDFYAAAVQTPVREEPAAVPDDGRPFGILFVGALQETKGISVLVEACRILENRGVDFKLHLVGGWESREFQERVMAKINEYKLEDRIILEGVLSADKKFDRYRHADIFCYPTFYECETFGIVLLEAMQFSLPVVASRWRGVQSVVRDGETGFLVPPKDSSALADKLQILIDDPVLRRQMQENGRRVYLREYTMEQFHRNMEAVFLSLVPGVKAK
jgi:glycosyltransferase involved in cell wall biosynthesis